MLKRAMIVLVASLGLTELALPQASAVGVSGSDAIVVRQASMDMSSVVLHAMADAVRSGREAKAEGYPATALAKWAKVVPAMFPPGTGKGEAAGDTRARQFAFTLPPGSYATLVVKRLFDRPGAPAEEPREASRPREVSRPPAPARTGPERPPAVGRTLHPQARRGRDSEGPPAGFRARAKARKEAREAARAAIRRPGREPRGN